MLKGQFEDLCSRMGARFDVQDVFDSLSRAYTESGRYYHNLEHIGACLDDFRCVSALSSCPEFVEFAIWFHDVVYDVRRLDSEEQSAEAGEAIALEAGLSIEDAEQISDLILITRHHRPPETIDEKIITDVDLAILGKPWAVYEPYEKAIRKEYAHVPENDFRKGRIAILHSFLERPSIYSLDYFQDTHHQQAVENIRRAISDLSVGKH